MLCTEEAGKALSPGTHGCTFGGNPVAAAAAIAAVRLPATRASSPPTSRRASTSSPAGRQMQARHPSLVKDVRGRGLLLGIELSFDAGPVVTRCRERGML